MRKSVELVARDIQVTAATQSQAIAYLREDAAEFRRQWNYENGGVDDAAPGDDLHDSGDEVDLDVSVDTPEGRGERTWTGEAVFTVVVEADSNEAAFATACKLMAA